MHVTMLLYPGLTQLDLTGPYEVLARVPRVTIDLVWKTIEPLKCGFGLQLMPTADFATAKPTDILFVPGGPGQLPLMADEEVLAFLRARGATAQYVTSVCTGSLLLAAAGLLQGYWATCHWLSLEQLALMGATPVAERVVVDGNRVTGAGVTSGIDFALTLVAKAFGEDRARIIQLGMEYDPQPPFDGGSPTTARPEDVAAIVSFSKDFQNKREEAARRAGERLGLG